MVKETLIKKLSEAKITSEEIQEILDNEFISVCLFMLTDELEDNADTQELITVYKSLEEFGRSNESNVRESDDTDESWGEYLVRWHNYNGDFAYNFKCTKRVIVITSQE